MNNLVDAVAGKRKAKRVKLKKGGFTIKHPGWSRARARKEGLTTRQWAMKHKGDAGVTGTRARSALGLMAMGK